VFTYARVVRFTDVDPDDMAAAEAALDGMDPADTPGNRASIDRCEIKAELGRG
jgi:hypothetical protein